MGRLQVKTERHLWAALQRVLHAQRVVGHASRFEVTTQTGVSDVEYVLNGWHGWVELKVSATARDDSPLRLGHALTAEQCAWLLSHHVPMRHLRSWMLIGLGGRSGGWRGFVLLPAPATPRFLRPVAPSLGGLRRDGFEMLRTIDAVVQRLTT